MDIVPPSYQSATTRDAWSVIARYIPSSDLCAVVLVCRRWHEVFMPFLWGNPASHFGTDNDDVYVALTRFRRTLRYARLEVRMLTHTLHMPPALSEIYGGPRPEWLREILEYLPCLQSLMVSELPFFDHNAMMALKGAGKYAHPANEAAFRTYYVRLLLACREFNTTSQGIAGALLHFSELIYLDLSYTIPARDQTVLSAISQLECLQVLKLRGIGLKDNDAEFLANAIGLRVRYLDLRNNKLTDMAIRSLLQACFLPPHRPRGNTFGYASSTNIKFLGSPTLDEKFKDALTHPLTGRSWVEDLPNVGITHLYIADNQITVEGAASLLSSTRLHVLDVGTVDTAKYVSTGRESLTPSHVQQILPGVEKLIPILGTLAKENITYLRAHHPICTSNARQRYPAPLPNMQELPADTVVGHIMLQELDGSTTRQIHELPADTNPVFELPATPILKVPEDDLPEVNNRREKPRYEDEPLPALRRGSAYAPEVLEIQDEEGSTLHTPRCNSPISLEDPRASKIQELLAKRPQGYSSSRGSITETSVPYLHPSHVPNVETLVLTDVPSHIPANSPILDSLIRFITACSNEALLANLQAGTDYSLPPGQDRANVEQQRAKSLFALRQIVLEITPVSQLTGPLNSTTWKSVSSQIGPYKSSTGDKDLEELWSSAVDDFSFFDETECGVPENDPGKYFPMAALNEKVSLVPEDDDFEAATFSSRPNRQNSRSKPKSNNQMLPPEPQVDLVAELAAFRRRKKLEYEQLIRTSYHRRSMNGRLSPHPQLSTGSVRSLSRSCSVSTLGTPSIPHYVEGHWKGEVKIVRNAAPRGRSGMVDMYGNYFEKGYLYP